MVYFQSGDLFPFCTWPLCVQSDTTDPKGRFSRDFQDTCNHFKSSEWGNECSKWSGPVATVTMGNYKQSISVVGIYLGCTFSGSC